MLFPEETKGELKWEERNGANYKRENKEEIQKNEIQLEAEQKPQGKGNIVNRRNFEEG